MRVYLIRHGQTPGNAKKQYIGRTDEPLSSAGEAALRALTPYPVPARVYCSPMLRARQTADILYAGAVQIVCPDLREMDFGTFEGRSADEMEHDPAYRIWVANGAMDVCPDGECFSSFATRTVAAFDAAVRASIVSGESALTLVAHGGSIMAILSALARPVQPVFSWTAANGCGYTAELDAASWERDPALTNVQPFPGGVL